MSRVVDAYDVTAETQFDLLIWPEGCTAALVSSASRRYLLNIQLAACHSEGHSLRHTSSHGLTLKSVRLITMPSEPGESGEHFVHPVARHAKKKK